MRVRGSLFCLAFALLLAAIVAGSAATAARLSCIVKDRRIAGVAHSRLVAERGATVVYSIRSPDFDNWWACSRGSGARTYVGHTDAFQNGGSEYGPNVVFSHLRLAGDWVVVVQEAGHADWIACGKYGGSPCNEGTESLYAADPAATNQRAVLTTFDLGSEDDASATAVRLKRVLLSAAGGVAWLLRRQTCASSCSAAPILTLYGCALAARSSTPACTPQALATGAIDPSSLRLRRTTLSWTAGGQSMSATLAAGRAGDHAA